MSNSEYREIKLRDGRGLAFAEYGSASGQPNNFCVPCMRSKSPLTKRSKAYI